MANHMKEVARILGVELGEKFKVKNAIYEPTALYFLGENGVYVFNGDGYVKDSVLCSLLRGDVKLVKLPFEPKKGERYYSYENDWSVIKTSWGNDMFDLCALKCGIVFRTEKEAIEARPKYYKELTGREWKSGTTN